MRHTLSMLLQNEAGALARVAGLFASRGYNIESLTVAATHDVEASRLTLVVEGDASVVEQIVKQSAKLVDVIDIAALTRKDHVERELVIARVHAGAAAGHGDRVRLLASEEGAQLVEFTGTAAEADNFLDGLRDRGLLLDHSRSGVAALPPRRVAAPA